MQRMSSDPTAHELDVDAEAALNPSYRRSITTTQHYEPLRREVFELETTTPSIPESTPEPEVLAENPQTREDTDRTPVSDAASLSSNGHISQASPLPSPVLRSPVSPLLAPRTGADSRGRVPRRVFQGLHQCHGGREGRRRRRCEGVHGVVFDG